MGPRDRHGNPVDGVVYSEKILLVVSNRSLRLSPRVTSNDLPNE